MTNEEKKTYCDKIGKMKTIRTLQQTSLFEGCDFNFTADKFACYDIEAVGNDGRKYLIECKTRLPKSYCNGEKFGRAYVTKWGLLYECKKTASLKAEAQKQNATAFYSTIVPGKYRDYIYLLNIEHFDRVPHYIKKKIYPGSLGGRKVEHITQLVGAKWFINCADILQIDAFLGAILLEKK